MLIRDFRVIKIIKINKDEFIPSFLRAASTSKSSNLTLASFDGSLSKFGDKSDST
jgi:hypothetical protein